MYISSSYITIIIIVVMKASMLDVDSYNKEDLSLSRC